MKRALFSREFRSALLPNLITAVAILASLMVVEKIYGVRFDAPLDARGFVDGMLLIGLVVSGFISGERCFPPELKEHRIFFLSSLPISWSGMWLAIVSGRLVAAMICALVVVSIRLPAFWTQSDVIPLPIALAIAAVALFAYGLFFSAGTLFALLFPRPLISYAVGYPLLGLLVLETLLAVSYDTSSFELRALQMFPPVDLAFFSVKLSMFVPFLILLFSFLALSLRFFVRGENANPQQRARNQRLSVLTALIYLLFIIVVWARPTLVGKTWETLGTSGAFVPAGVSLDGRYLFTGQNLAGLPGIRRISIVDTRTGRLMGQALYKEVYWGYWSRIRGYPEPSGPQQLATRPVGISDPRHPRLDSPLSRGPRAFENPIRGGRRRSSPQRWPRRDRPPGWRSGEGLCLERRRPAARRR